jgi:hypothetical protein
MSPTSIQTVSTGTGTLLKDMFISLNAELNSICHLLALLEAHQILHISRIRVIFLETLCL